MLKALFSIKPEYVERIFSGKKKYEFRTVVCKKPIQKIVIYETSPVCKIVGEVGVISIIKNSPDLLWKQTSEFSGISFDSFSKYFKNRKVGYAYVLSETKIYEKPKNLSDFGISSPPQSFIYLEE